MTGVFSNYACYYDALYHDKDYAAEAGYFAGLVRRFEKEPSRSLLEFGAGSGGHQREFVLLGFDTIGVELSEEMCAIALERGSHVVSGDFKTYLHGETFDTVMALFHVVSYLTTNEDIDAGFRNARAHLAPGGLFVFDVWHEDAVVSQKPETRVKKITTDELYIVRIAEPTWRPEQKTVQVNYTIFAKQHGEELSENTVEAHLMRYFSVQDIRDFAERNGFDVLTIEETLTGAPVTEGSWGISAVLRAV